jgi:hypothetical protein
MKNYVILVEKVCTTTMMISAETEQEAKDFAIEQLQEFNEDENSSYENITTSIVDCREFKEIVEF